MRSGEHFNDNVLGVIDVETTGVIPGHHDIIEVAVIILDYKYDIDPTVTPFAVDLRPKRPENIDLQAVSVIQDKFASNLYNKETRDKVISSRERITTSLAKGMSAEKAADLFFQWFENLKLLPYRRILPIAHNWVFDRGFMIDWLGYDGFDHIFDPRYRDTMSNALFENDCADWFATQYPYAKVNLQYLCSQLKVERPRCHRALDDAVATAEVFKKMIKSRR